MRSRSNKINASSLFHFTRKFDTLQSIVRNGLRFSYAFERFSPNIIANFNYPSNPQLVLSTYKNAGVAIPMISFCDIPITRTAEHIGKYGQYMIGLDKEFIIDTYNEIINPVLYIHSNNLGDAFDEISNVYAEAHNKQIEQVLDYSDKKEPGSASRPDDDESSTDIEALPEKDQASRFFKSNFSLCFFPL